MRVRWKHAADAFGTAKRVLPDGTIYVEWDPGSGLLNWKMHVYNLVFRVPCGRRVPR